MLGERLKKLKELHNISSKELCEKLGVNRSTISHYEHGTRHPSFERLLKLANIFDVSVDYLVGNEPDDSLYRKIESALADEPELLEFFEMLKTREDLKQLFRESRDMPPEFVRRAIRVIKALEEDES